MALLPGSFDPPTAAHLMLAERARSEGFDNVMFLLALRTAGKPSCGMMLEDRLMALRAIAGEAFAVGVCSHALYADQAEAAAARFPDADLAFLVGSDKVFQLFEDRWYTDRDAALERLFACARLIVAPRSDQTERLRAVLDDPHNAVYAERVQILRLHPAVGDLSSTRVRGLLRAGADPSGLVPSSISDLLAETRAYAGPIPVGSDEVDAYEVRRDLIELIWSTHGSDGVAIDLRRLTRIATSATEPGRQLRAILSNGGACAADLAYAQAMASGL
jgi:nicotinic acid mononucleotide adenylyltransferase